MGAGGREAAGGGEAADLGTVGNRSSELSHQADRERRGRLRAKLRKHARRDLVRKVTWSKDFVSGSWAEVERLVPRDDRFLACGMRSRGAGRVTITKTAAGRAGYGNLQACSSVWACPCCAPKIMKQRADDLGRVLAWARREGHTVALITLTLRHHKPEHLADLWDLLSQGWGRVTSGAGWVSESEEKYRDWLDDWEHRRDLAERGLGRFPQGGRSGTPRRRRIGDQERYGVLGYARAVEVTHGSHGWHPHVHAVVILENKAGGAEGQFLGHQAAKALGRSMFDRWARAMPEQNRPDADSGGLDVTVSLAAEKKLAEYLTKDGLGDSDEHVRNSVEKAGRDVAMEATHGHAKLGRKPGSRTPFQILADLDYDRQTKKRADQDLATWLEWIEASSGRRQITWSVGLRELAGMLEDELTDEELAEADDPGDVVLTLPTDTWRAVRRESWVLLDILEIEGMEGLTGYLDRLGLEYGHPAYERMTEWADTDIPLWGDEDAA